MALPGEDRTHDRKSLYMTVLMTPDMAKWFEAAEVRRAALRAAFAD